MLRAILESKVGSMTNFEFAEVLDLATTDIMINRVGFKQKTNLEELAGIAGSCLGLIRRYRVAENEIRERRCELWTKQPLNLGLRSGESTSTGKLKPNFVKLLA